MVRAGTVVPVERLRDQVYRLIRDDLEAGVLKPGERIVEVELAERYRVSRTPVREALFQVVRDGLLAASGARGYVVATDTPQAAAHRDEIRDLLDPQLAYHAAIEGAPEQRKALVRAHERQCAAHEANRVAAFCAANNDFRATLRSMCANTPLAKRSALVDDQAQASRRAASACREQRQRKLGSNARLLKAVLAGDGPAARAEMHAYIDALRPSPAAIAAE